MSEVYLYEPRNFSPGYAYYDFDEALAHFLKDCEVSSLSELAEELKEYDLWYEFDVDRKSVYVDDGGRITPLELR